MSSLIGNTSREVWQPSYLSALMASKQNMWQGNYIKEYAVFILEDALWL